MPTTPRCLAMCFDSQGMYLYSHVTTSHTYVSTLAEVQRLLKPAQSATLVWVNNDYQPRHIEYTEGIQLELFPLPAETYATTA